MKVAPKRVAWVDFFFVLSISKSPSDEQKKKKKGKSSVIRVLCWAGTVCFYDSNFSILISLITRRFSIRDTLIHIPLNSYFFFIRDYVQIQPLVTLRSWLPAPGVVIDEVWRRKNHLHENARTGTFRKRIYLSRNVYGQRYKVRSSLQDRGGEKTRSVIR